MTESVVYILGAGFSAPLGLPVVSNFLETARDLLFHKPKEYGHFGVILERIQKLHQLKGYFNADLFNIEEVLSIVEMDTSIAPSIPLEAPTLRGDMQKLITGTIEAKTPSFVIEGPFPNNWWDHAFGSSPEYTKFLASLYGLGLRNVKPVNPSFDPKDSVEVELKSLESRPTKYSVITLNYDLVVENALRFFTNFNTDITIRRGKRDERLPLAKLHGSVDKTVVPPTWNKTLSPEIEADWKLAYELLSSANHVRILGYSLPPGDSYVRFLLKAALKESRHLKSLDVLCLDPTGEVEARYDEFVAYPNYGFANANLESYLSTCVSGARSFPQGRSSPSTLVDYGDFAQAHSGFFPDESRRWFRSRR